MILTRLVNKWDHVTNAFNINMEKVSIRTILRIRTKLSFKILTEQINVNQKRLLTSFHLSKVKLFVIRINRNVGEMCVHVTKTLLIMSLCMRYDSSLL